MRLNTPNLHLGDPLYEILAIRQEPVGAFCEIWQRGPDLLVEFLHREQRNQPNQRPQLERCGPSIEKELVA